MKYDNKPK